MTEFPVEMVREFVISSHFNLDKVKSMLAEHPDLLTVQYDWGESGFEDGLGAAAHVGNRTIAEFFLAQGVPSNICVAAMLGDEEAVEDYLKGDASLATARGAHGITVLFHTAMSGKTRIADMLIANGGGEGANHAVHGAVAYGQLEMVNWLLDHGVTDINSLNHEGKTPLKVAEENEFSEIAEVLKANGGVDAVA